MPNTIAQNLQRLQQARAAIANSIVAKGGIVPSGDGLEEFAADISTIAPYEMTGELPLAFKSDGESLRGYAVKGKNVRTANLFDKDAVTVGMYIVYMTGKLNPAEGTNASDYIDVGNAEYIHISGGSNVLTQWGAFYDNSKNYVGAITEYNRSIEVPQNAKFVRITVVDEELDNLMLNAGSTALPYEPYYDGIGERTANLVNYDVWKNVGTSANGTAVWENNGVTLTATTNDFYTNYSPAAFSEDARVSVNEGDVILLSWECDTNLYGENYIFPNGSTIGFVSANNANTKQLSYTVPSGVTFITFRFGVAQAGNTISYKNIMIQKVPSGQQPASYEPYGYKISVEYTGMSNNLCNGIAIQGGISTYTGELDPTITNRISLFNMNVTAGETYTFSSNQYVRCIYGYDSNGDPVQKIVDTPEDGAKNTTFTVPQGCSKVGVSLMNSSAASAATSIVPSDLQNAMLNEGSTALPYVPFGPEQKTLNLYTPSKLYEGDTLTYAQTGVDIPTVNDVNTLDTTLNTKFEMDIQYGDFPIYDNINAAINTLKGTDTTYKPADMADAILDAIPDVEVSGDIVSVTDAAAYPAEGLEFAIEPVQDLHGYDKPWPAGGGKNLLPMTVEGIKTANTAGTWVGDVYTVNGVSFEFKKEGDYYTEISLSGTASGGAAEIVLNNSTILNDGDYVLSGCPVGGSGNTYYLKSIRGIAGTDTGSGTGVISQTDENPLYIFVTISNGVNANGLLFKPMIRLASDTDPTFAPYSNICPISGWTGVNGERTGVNVFDKTTAEVGYINDNTGEVNPMTSYMCTDYIVVEPNATYYVKTEQNNGGWGAWYDADKNYISGVTNYFDTTITAPTNARYVRLTCLTGTSGNIDTFAINYPSTNTEYHAYTGTSIPITFPAAAGTVYGGKVDVINGKLRVTNVMPDGSNWNQYAQNNGYKAYRMFNVGIAKSSTSGISDSIGNFGSFSSSSMNKNIIQLPYEDSIMYMALQEDIDPTTIQVVYELATPIEYDITPQQVQMLLGDNNVWCDTGDTTLEYKVDLGRFIAKLQAAQVTPQLSLSRQAVSLDAPMDETTQNEDEGDER